MRVLQRTIVGVVLAISILILVAAASVFVLTRTDWGHERIRRIAQRELQAVTHGQVRIGRVSGNLLTGMTVYDLSIRDSSGAPFVAAEAVRADYGLLDLFHKRIWIRNVVLTRPVVVLDRPPNERWNWVRLFGGHGAARPPGAPPTWGSWIRFTDARVIEGSFAVRWPWKPNASLSAPARDSEIAHALHGGDRSVIERVPGGFQTVVSFDSVTATVPLLRLAQPGETQKLIRVTSLSTRARAFGPPAAEVVDVHGTFPFTSDSIWGSALTVRLPGSVISGSGSYLFDSGDMTLRLHAAPVALADLRWLYPRFPSTGGGPTDFTLTWRGAVEDYHAENTTVVIGNTTVAGRSGVHVDKSVTLYDTHLKFRDLDTRLIEQLAPAFKSPRRGQLTGSATLAGTLAAMQVDGDVSFADQRAGTSHVAGHGEIRFPTHGVVMRALTLRLEPLQVGLLVEDMTSPPPISGVLTGTATLDGSTTSSLQIVGDVMHTDSGATSQLTGRGTISFTGQHQFMLDVDAHPVSLVEVGRFAPGVGLLGTATGLVSASGTMARFGVKTDLRLSDGGAVSANGSIELDSAKRYDLTAGVVALDLQSFLRQGPTTAITGRAQVRGSGFALATLQGAVTADVSASRWDSVTIDTGSVRLTVANGRAEVDRLTASGYHTNLTASGAFGLTRDQSGTLTYQVAIDSLGAFDRWIPGASGDTALVPPRPGLVASALKKARADSARIAQQTEVERIVTGRAPPKLKVVMPRSVRADTIGGTFYAAGTATGNIYALDARGRAGGENITARGDFVRRFQSDYAWTGVRTSKSNIVVGIDADTVMANGFALDTVAVRLAYRDSAGHVDLLVRQGTRRDYTLSGDFTLASARNEMRIADLRLRLDSAVWSAPHPATVKWGGPGVEVVNFELRNRANGRIALNGLLPTEGTANFSASVDNLPIVDVVDLLQSDLELSGLVTLDASMSGTASHPAFRGAFGVLGGRYGTATLPVLRGRFGYADEMLVTHVEATRREPADSATLALLDARLPLNLAFTGVTGSRLLHQPLQVSLSGDSLPIDIVPEFTSAVANMHGAVAGKIDMSGSYDRPVLVGGVTMKGGAVTITKTGMAVDGVTGSVRMANDTVYVDSLVGRSRGLIRVSGTIGVGSWREPSFNLSLAASSAYVLDNANGKLQAVGALTLTGPLSNMELDGHVTVVDGVIYGPESTSKHVIPADDPDLFNVIDTAVTSERGMMPSPSPLMQDLHMNVAVSIDRDTWARTHDANIEIYTDDPITVRGTLSEPDLTGAITTDRGDYTFLSRRFQLSHGSALFVGGRDINPTLQLTGEYQVQVTGAPQTNVKVLIGGTLRKPKLVIESDAQPPKSQSELLSLLAFGHSTSSLLALDGSSVTGAPTGTGVVGLGAQFAAGRMADVAMGVIADQLQSKAGQALGTDYLNITPADVPTEVAQGSSVGSFFQQTEVEAGKYLNPRTFLEARTIGGYPGLRIQYRTAEGWIYEANAEPRIVLLDPTLSEQPYRTRSVLGLILLRQWRF